MKYIILILSIFLVSCECEIRTEETIDGCQYIKTTSNTGNGPVISLTHKGNCNNPIHFKKDTI